MRTFLTALIMPLIAAGTAGAAGKPAEGFALHIDAKLHFPGRGDAIAHHYCKPVAGGLTECLLFASDDADAPVVGVEVIAGPDVYATFDADEKKLWHYHKTEIPKVEAVLPEVTAEEAANIVKSVEETYGKIYLLWDPTKNKTPTGSPSITLLE